MAFEIITEPTPTAPKMMIYGRSGVGKTTLASQLKNSLIIDLEGGSNYLSTPRTKLITNVEKVYEILAELYRAPERKFDMICFDSVDWLVTRITQQVAGTDKRHLDATLNKSNGGFGNGKQVLKNHIMARFIPTLDALNSKGYGICLVAHTETKNLSDDEGVMVEKFAPKIDENTMNTFLEWCDNVFYLKKDINDDRVLVLEGDSTAVAKNRLGLTGEVKLKDNDINDIIKLTSMKKEK